MTKSPLFWLQRLWCIPLRLVFMLQDRISGDLDLVWLEPLWKGYRGYIGETLVIGKNWVHRWAGGLQVLSVKVSHRTSRHLDLVVAFYHGVPLRAR